LATRHGQSERHSGFSRRSALEAFRRSPAYAPLKLLQQHHTDERQGKGTRSLCQAFREMPSEPTLRGDPIGRRWIHLCVDMQRLFEPGTEWGLEWMPRVLPNIVRLCERAPARSVLTRFIPAQRPGEGTGTWRRYYERWADMTRERLDEDMVRLVPALRPFVPPATVVDKMVYSPWLGSTLRDTLNGLGCDTLFVTGGETDMCVLSTVLGAADFGYRTILVQDALCSASDEAHESILRLFSTRFGQQIETATTDQVLERLDDEGVHT
jgi:nicotinamidase-related amidase